MTEGAHDPSAPGALAAGLERRAHELGFSLFGIVGPDPSVHMDAYRAWLARNLHGDMAYLARSDSVARREDLRLTMETVRSVVLVGHEYYNEDPPNDSSRAVIARYALGDDYHGIVKDKLSTLLEWLDEASFNGVAGRAYVDTGPILERDLARRAGLGWFGRNTMLISPSRGSFFFIGLLLVDVELPPSGSFDEDRCGTCEACLEACPTRALLGRDEMGAPIIDARLCISYLTIESRGAIPTELRPLIGNRVFGCDICQDVCPWNGRFAQPTAESAYRPRDGLTSPRLSDLIHRLVDMDDAGFRAHYRGSAVKRARREGLLRNACVALGNHLFDSRGDDVEAEVVALERALLDVHPLVRGHAAWALGQALRCPGGNPRAHAALSARRDGEPDPWVRTEIDAGLDRGERA